MTGATKATNVDDAVVPDVPPTDLSPSLSSFDAELFEPLTGREESWRFTPLRRLRGLELGNHGQTGLSYLMTGPATVALSKDAAEQVRDRVIAPSDRVAALAWEAVREVAHVAIPANAVSEQPVHVTITATGDATCAGHVLIEAGANSATTVVLDHLGDGAYAGDVTVRLAQGAQLRLASLQQQEPEGVLVSNINAELEADAQLKAVAITLGGDVVRCNTAVRFAGRGGEAVLLGAFFTAAGQHQEHRLFVDHAQPDCRSDVAYKGALAGDKAHSVWVGDVLIRANATGTSTYELNRNLVLTDGARADSVPNLEIETGEVAGAGHAAATGRFDEEQLFYLQSRGIPRGEARRLVVLGFFADVARRIGVEAVADALVATVEERLSEYE